MEHKELPLEFTGNGQTPFKFKRIMFNPDFAIYKVNAHGATHYEVITRRWVHPIKDWQSKLIDEMVKVEKYPKTKDFGSAAWTYRNLGNAISKFNNLTR